jgi:hypothetical protein
MMDVAPGALERDIAVPPGRRKLPAWWLPLAIALVYSLIAVMLPHAWNGIGALFAYRLPLVLGLLGVVPFTIGVLRCRVRIGGPAATGWPAALRLAHAEGWLGERLVWFAALLIVIPVFFWGFAAWKTQVGPFRWDVELAQLDRVIHGTDPYRLLPQSLYLTRLMDGVYWMWNYLFLAVMLWQGWAGSRRDRIHFWLAFVLTWVLLGTVLAHAVSSAGPCYYDRVTGSFGPFANLQAHLEAVDRLYDLRLFVLRDYLWSGVERAEVAFAGGISAFPSLHIAMPTLACCAAWRVSRWLAGAFAIFAVVTLICAVGLGWHYAVDGYASMLLVPMIWRVAGLWAGRREAGNDE